ASAERDFIISRVFPVPREVAFRAWTDPARLCHWWGPEGFSNPVCRVDCRTGGQYLIVMRSPDGTDYPLKGEFREIIPPERITFTMDCSENPEEWRDIFTPGRDRELPRPTLLSLANVWFEELAAKTK